MCALAHVLMRLYPVDKSLFVYKAKDSGRHVMSHVRICKYFF